MNGLPIFMFDNRFADNALTASSTAAGDFDKNYLVDWRPYTWWQPTSLPATITVTAGTVKSVDYVLVWGHDLGTQGATLELRGSTDDFSASDVLVQSWSPSNDDPFIAILSSTDYDYWRWRITGSTVPSLAILAAGEKMELPKYLRQGFDPLGRESVGKTNTSVDGHPLGQAIDYEKWAQTITLRNVTWSWIRNTFEPAYDVHLKLKPFGFAWDPTDHATEIYLLSPAGKFQTPHKGGVKADLIVPVNARAA